MEIDTKNLIKDITLLEELLNKYEDNNNEVFSELYKIREYYSGEDATYFNNKINTENNNYLILLDILKRNEVTPVILEDVIEDLVKC